MEAVNIANNSVALLVMVCVLMSTLIEHRRYPQGRSFYLPLLIADIAMIVCLLLASIALALGGRGLYLVMSSLSFVCLYVVLVLFVFGITNFISRRAAVEMHFVRRSTLVLCAVSALGCIAVILADAETSVIVPLGAAKLIAQLGALWVIGVTLYLTMRYHRMLERGVARSFSSLLLLPLLAIPLRMLRPELRPMPLLLSAALLLLYNDILLQQSYLLRRQELRLEKDRMQISLSQIRPHFLYNTLNSIYYLCEKDSDAAKRAVEDFSAYLRGNLDSIERDEKIPLQQELEHVRHYLRLEQMRFDDELHVRYEIEADDFFLPQLTLQPWVENAVKHGVSKQPGGGTVTIRSRELPRFYEIAVIDDGVGFSPDRPQRDDRTHIGIANVRSRLWEMSRAELRIVSAPGRGTTATILVPKLPERERRGFWTEVEADV